MMFEVWLIGPNYVDEIRLLENKAYCPMKQQLAGCESLPTGSYLLSQNCHLSQTVCNKDAIV